MNGRGGCLAPDASGSNADGTDVGTPICLQRKGHVRPRGHVRCLAPDMAVPERAP
jgi:hypothetical protein